MKSLLLAVALLSSGCLGNAFYVDSRFTAEEQSKIRAAAEAWEAVGAPPFDFIWRQKVDLNDTGRMVIVKAGDRACLNHDARFVDWYAVTERGTGYERIIIDQDAGSPATFQPTIAHEFGHHLGLAHTEISDAVMHTPAVAIDGPTAADAAALRGEL